MMIVAQHTGKIDHCGAEPACQVPPQRCRAYRLGSMKGQDLVEFAVVVPLFLLLTFAVFDCGRLFFVQMNLQQAVQEAGRFASTGNHLPNPQNPSQNLSRIASINAYVQNAAWGAEQMGASVSALQVSSVNGGSGNAGGPQDTETISLVTNLPLMTPLVAKFFPGGQYTFTSSTTVKNEPFPPAQTN